MSEIQDFVTELQRRAKCPFARWHKIDLHNHSPSSHDYRGPKDLAEAAAASRARAREAGLDVIMFTDHERLPELTFTEDVAKSSGCLVVRGVELNVFVPAWSKPSEKVSRSLYFHLLIGFDPDGAQPPDYWLDRIYHKCQTETRDCGSRKIKGITSPIEQLMEVLEDSNTLVIPAHLHSDHDAFRSRSIDDIFADPEFLKYAPEYFTALEVVNESTADFFDGNHEETNWLEKTCIRSSDSHEPNTLGSRPTYAQMEKRSFLELKAALELPFRISRKELSGPAAYVEGMHVRGSFLKDTWLSFSPHCNVLIGVKGLERPRCSSV